LEVYYRHRQLGVTLDEPDVVNHIDATWAAFFDPPSATATVAQSERFRLRVTVTKGEAVPEAWDTEAFGFEDHGDCWIAETCRVESLPEKIKIGLPGLPEDSVAVESFADDEFYFQIDARIAAAEPPAPVAPERIALVWDASLSRATVDKGRDFELLKALASRLGAVDIDLFVLRHVVEDPQPFSLAAGECETLLETLAELSYDGGTSLDDLELCFGDYDAYIVFSDGVSTLGEDLPNVAGIPIYVVSSDIAANRPILRHLAAKSGGAYLDLTRVPVEQASQEIFNEGLSFLGMEYDEGAIADVYPSSRVRVQDGAITVSGQLLKDEAEITLRFGRVNEETERRSFRLSRHAATSTGLIGRLWAQRKVDELSVFEHRYRAELLDLGRRFHIVTPNSSLLVLETLEQHLEHEIAPAPSRRKMRRKYDQVISKRQAEDSKRQDKKLEQVLAWWRDRVQWWEKEFDPSPPEIREVNPEGEAAQDPGDATLFMRAAPASAAHRRAESRLLHAVSDSSMGMDAALSETCGAVAAPAGMAPAPDDSIADQESTSASIAVKPWDPNTPYLEVLKSTGEDDVYEEYLEQRTTYGRSPAFYLDCADYLFKVGQRHLALRILTNVAELELESPQLLRILAYKLETEGELDLAARVFEQVLAMRPEEPQSHRDLALVLDRRGEYKRSAELLWAVVTGEWDSRFPEIETIALMELNRVLERARRNGEGDIARDLGIDERLVKLLDQDLRVVLSWDADLTDVDLWVIEPNGEKCFYSHNRTRMGGRLSPDFTQGYGPEEYVLRRGMPGAYSIQANYYGSSQQTLTGPATVFAAVFTNFGRQDEERRILTIRLTEVKDVIEVGEVKLGDS